jgi:hypothetical protein
MVLNFLFCTKKLLPAISIFLLAVICFINLYYFKPRYPWDLIGYVAAAYTFRGDSDVHRLTYADIKHEVPPSLLKDLLTSVPYRRAVAESPESLQAQVRFYLVKPVYPLLMIASNKLTGLSLISASIWISRVAYVGAVLFLFWWLQEVAGSSLIAFLLAAALASSGYVVALAQYSTPDALSMLSCFLMWWLFMHRRVELALTLAVLMVAIRPDNLLLVILLGAMATLEQPRAGVGALVLAGIALYSLVTWYAEHPGWKFQFYHSFVEYVAQRDLPHVDLTAVDYFKTYAGQLRPNANRSLWVFGPLILAGLVLTHRQKKTRLFQMLVINFVFIILHWVAHPGEKDRLLVSAYVIGIVGLAGTVPSAAYGADSSHSHHRLLRIIRGAARRYGILVAFRSPPSQ